VTQNNTMQKGVRD